ncbi:MAG: Ref family recombination enhancement nuclease [Burkholderiaceae bacterium]
MTAKEIRRYMGLVADLGCALCWRKGWGATPAQLHHPRRGTGMGQRASNMDVIPLCWEHHQGATGIHGLGTKGFEKEHGISEADLLLDTRARLI